MPILPTYQGVSTSIATPTTPKLPDDPFTGQLKRLGEATEDAGNAFGRVMQKRQALEDEAAAMQRYMQADSELQDLTDSFSKPEIGRTARETFAKTVEQKRAEWFKGLTPGASARLEQHLAPKILENRSAALKIENRVHLNDYQAGGQDAQRRTIDALSRITDERDGKDTDEYKALQSYVEVGQKNGYYTPQEADTILNTALVGGAQSRILKLTVSTSIPEIDNALNIIKKENGEPVYMATENPTGLVAKGNIDIMRRPQVKNPDGSISTVRSMSFEEDGEQILIPTVSETGKLMDAKTAIDYYHATGKNLGKFDTPENATAYAQTLHDQQAALLTQKTEGQAKSGGTFLRHLDPAHRLQAEKDLLARKDHLEKAELARIREERRETKERHDEEMKAVAVRVQQKLNNPEKYGVLTQDQLDLYADNRLISDNDYKQARDTLTSRETSGTMMTGGRGNPAVITDFSQRVYSTKSTGDAQQVMGELKAAIARGDVPSGQGQVGQVWMAHLDSLTRIPRDQDITPAKQTSDAKSYVALRLRTTGPAAQYLKPGENDAIAAINRELDNNAIKGYPEPPMAIVDRMLPTAQAQVGQPAQATISERRRSMGMPITSDPAKARESREEAIRSAVQQYRSAPQGPEGDALRTEAQNLIHKLRELSDLEDAQAKRKAAIEESRGKTGPAPGASSAPATKPSGPLLGPKR